MAKADKQPQPLTLNSTRLGARFKCLGSSCPDTCCSGWTIELDRRSYEQYHGALDAEVRLIASTGVVKKPAGKKISDTSYAVIKTNEVGDCPFLSETRLCGIQGSLGEAALSPACTVYPRELYQSNQLHGPIEILFSLSCPEVARICVSDPDAMEAEQLEPDYFAHKAPVVVNQVSLGRMSLQSHLVKYLKTINGYSTLGLFARYVTLQLYVDQLVRFQSNLNSSQSFVGGDLVNHLRVMAHQLETVQAMSADLDYQADRLTEAWLIIYQSRQPSAGFVNLTKEMLDIIGSDRSRVALGILLERGLPEVQSFFFNHPHVLSNVLLNEFSRFVYQEGNGKGLYDCVDLVFVRIALIRLSCAYLVAGGSTMSGEIFTRVLAAVSRMMGHNRVLARGILRHLITTDADRVPTMGLLLALPDPIIRKNNSRVA